MLLNLEKETLPNLGVGVLVIHFVRGVSQTLRARSSNPGVELVALCSCEVNHCSICVSNVLISSDIILCIITVMFIVPGGTGPSSSGVDFGIECQVEPVFLRELVSGACCVCVRGSFAAGVFPGMDRGCIGATGLQRCHCGQLASQGLILSTDTFHLRLLSIVLLGPHGGRQTVDARNLRSNFNQD
ncbi:hypothetical protein TIFTF001_029027 [Ficus carica]|uniref:Uncharacterized protein n=1 Tax=Ficus carica TaxID=3494 RepID=A0AA88IXE6_FICCA|nr:hypothetical protein TIFTF001_029027 [Ficus carica]